jgi:hypothetical protein
MKTCEGCAFVEWKTTKAGKRHPSGDGRCTYQYKVPPLPQALYWWFDTPPRPSGGYVNRKSEHREHCDYYTKQGQ